MPLAGCDSGERPARARVSVRIEAVQAAVHVVDYMDVAVQAGRSTFGDLVDQTLYDAWVRCPTKTTYTGISRASNDGGPA